MGTKRAAQHDYEQIRMTFGFVVRALMVAGRWDRPGLPDAAQLVELTKRAPDLVMHKPWTLAQAKYVLAHMDDLAPVAKAEGSR